MPVFFDELVALYGNGGDTDALPSVRPYADYLVWLAAQNHDAALGTWREYLVGLDGPTRLAPPRAQDGSPAIPQRWEADLPTELTARLQALARQRGLTLNTVVQGLWAVLLGRLTGRDDVVFGVTVAGRPAELAGVERMVGLFINTLLARILVNDDRPLADWLREIQAKQAEADQFAFSSLADVQCWSEVPGGTPLFDSILVFENYPVDRSLDGQPGGLKVSDGRAFEQTNYPLSLEIVPEVRTLVRLRYDTGRFGAATVRLLLDQILTLLEAFAADLGRTLGDLASPAPAGRPAPVVPHRETHVTRRGDAAPGRRTGGPATREESRLAAIWRVEVRPGGPRPPLFLMPGAGGNVLYFHPLAKRLSPGRAIFGLQAIGLDGTTPPLTQVEEIAARNLESVRRVAPSGPYILAGHSFGGRVAFEMSQQLRRQGNEVGLLAILDTPAPVAGPDPACGSWDDARWLVAIAGEVGTFLGVDLEITYEQLAGCDRDAQLDLVIDRIADHGRWLLTGADASQLRAFLAVYKANFETNYHPASDVHPVPIVLFRAGESRPGDVPPTDEVAALMREPTWGWGRFAEGPVEVVDLPGDHLSSCSSPTSRCSRNDWNGSWIALPGQDGARR